MPKQYRLAVLNSHPIQYFAPLYRLIADSQDIDISVYYCSRQGLDGGHVDPGFGNNIVWDVPLLDGYRYKFLPNLWGDLGAKGFFSLINPGIVLEIFRQRFDAIIIHGHNFATNILAMFAAKLVGTHVFVRGETHLLLDRGSLKRFARKPIMGFFYKLCDACLYIGTLNRTFYRALGVPEAKLFATPYTVDNDFFISKSVEWLPSKDSVKAELGISSETPVILYASKLIARKRPLDLLRAYEDLRKNGIAAALVFVGDGPEMLTLAEWVKEHSIEDVYFLGFRNQTALPKYFTIADVFVLPAENEPWGLIVNEVMCAGIPVITTREVGAGADLVADGSTGFIYDCGDIKALGEMISKILTDRELRQKMSRASLELIRSWSYQECVSGITIALRNTASNRHGQKVGKWH